MYKYHCKDPFSSYISPEHLLKEEVKTLKSRITRLEGEVHAYREAIRLANLVE